MCREACTFTRDNCACLCHRCGRQHSRTNKTGLASLFCTTCTQMTILLAGFDAVRLAGVSCGQGGWNEAGVLIKQTMACRIILQSPAFEAHISDKSSSVCVMCFGVCHCCVPPLSIVLLCVSLCFVHVCALWPVMTPAPSTDGREPLVGTEDTCKTRFDELLKKKKTSSSVCLWEVSVGRAVKTQKSVLGQRAPGPESSSQ